MNTDTVLQHYVVCALWSSTDNYGADDIAPETMHQMREDVEDFCKSNDGLLEQSGQSDEQIGHDFWLTRNGHGAGFWDRGLGEVGEQLTKAAKIYGPVDLYIGDDWKVHG